MEITNETLNTERFLYDHKLDGFVFDMEDQGYQIFNPKSRRLIVEEIKDLGWSHWFARTSDRREYGGIIVSMDYRTINPIITVGLNGAVYLPTARSRDNIPVITVHSHNNVEDPVRAMPSQEDWCAAANSGWHIVVTYWGIFAHFASGRQIGICKWETQSLVFVPRCELTGEDIGRDLFTEYR